MSILGNLRDAATSVFGVAGVEVARSISLGIQRFGMSSDLALARITEQLDARGSKAWGASSKTTITQLIPPTISTWSYDAVRGALEEHELGLFYTSSALMDAMGRDDRISACLNTRVNALVGKAAPKFSVLPSPIGDNRKKADDTANRVAKWWRYGVPETTMARMHRDVVQLGFAIAKIHWDRMGGERVPRLEVWDPHAVYWNWGLNQYIAMSQEGVFPLTPGEGEWFVFEPGGRRSWMTGGVRALGVPYVFRGYSQRDWSRYCEKHGLPILAIKEPQGNQWNMSKAGFFNSLKRLGKESVLRLPYDDKDYGFSVDIIEPKDTSWEAFKEFLIRLDINIAVFLLGQNLTTEAGTNGGSHAAVLGADRVRLDYLCSDASAFSVQLREQVVKPWMAFNVKPDDEEEAPYPTWALDAEEDKQAKSTVFYTFAETAAALAKAPGVAVDLAAAARALDIPLLDKQPSGDPQLPAGPPGSGQPGADGDAGAAGQGRAPKVPGAPPALGAKGKSPAPQGGGEKSPAEKIKGGPIPGAPRPNMDAVSVTAGGAIAVETLATPLQRAHAIGVKHHGAIDAIMAAAAPAAAAAMKPALEEVIDAVTRARDAPDPRGALRAELLTLSNRTPPAEMTEAVRRAGLLAYAAGRRTHTVHAPLPARLDHTAEATHVLDMSNDKPEALTYDPAQPRVPAGSPDGGEFAGGGSAAEGHLEAIRAASNEIREGNKWGRSYSDLKPTYDARAAAKAYASAAGVPAKRIAAAEAVNSESYKEAYAAAMRSGKTHAEAAVAAAAARQAAKASATPAEKPAHVATPPVATWTWTASSERKPAESWVGKTIKASKEAAEAGHPYLVVTKHEVSRFREGMSMGKRIDEGWESKITARQPTAAEHSAKVAEVAAKDQAEAQRMRDAWARLEEQQPKRRGED